MKAPLYEELYRVEETYWWFRARRSIVLDLLKRYAPDKADLNIVDVGCGCGYTIYEFSKYYKNIIGVEFGKEAVKFCEKRGIEVIQGEFPSGVDLKDESFDVVLILDVLEHVHDDKGFLEKGAAILKPGGIIIVTVPAYPFLWTHRDEYHEHVRRYTKKGFRKLFNDLPLKKIAFSYFNFFLFLPITISRLLSKVLGYDKKAPDINVPPKPINSALEKMFSLEKYLLGKINLPWGVSLIAVYRKRQVDR